MGGSARAEENRGWELHGELGGGSGNGAWWPFGVRVGARTGSGRSGEGKREGERAPELEGRACGSRSEGATQGWCSAGDGVRAEFGSGRERECREEKRVGFAYR